VPAPVCLSKMSRGREDWAEGMSRDSAYMAARAEGGFYAEPD
jgi:hypothetical protein